MKLKIQYLIFISLIFTNFVNLSGASEGSGDSEDDSGWENCVTIGVDYTGDNVIQGLRFSNAECAIWCRKIGNSLFPIGIFRKTDKILF